MAGYFFMVSTAHMFRHPKWEHNQFCLFELLLLFYVSVQKGIRLNKAHFPMALEQEMVHF